MSIFRFSVGSDAKNMAVPCVFAIGVVCWANFFTFLFCRGRTDEHRISQDTGTFFNRGGASQMLLVFTMILGRLRGSLGCPQCQIPQRLDFGSSQASRLHRCFSTNGHAQQRGIDGKSAVRLNEDDENLHMFVLEIEFTSGHNCLTCLDLPSSRLV